MYTFDYIKGLISEFDFPCDFQMVVAIANGGLIPAALINQRLSLDFNVIKINLRDTNQKPIYDSPKLIEEMNFNPKGKRIILVEDRVKSGATLAMAKKILMEAGAEDVKTFAVNGVADYSLLNVPCFKFPWIL